MPFDDNLFDQAQEQPWQPQVPPEAMQQVRPEQVMQPHQEPPRPPPPPEADVPFTQSDKLALQRFQQAESTIEQQRFDGTIDNNAADDLQRQLQSRKSSLEKKQATASQKGIQKAAEQAMQATAQEEAIRSKHQEFRVKNFDKSVARLVDPVSGATAYFTQDSKGDWSEVKFDHHHTQEDRRRDAQSEARQFMGQATEPGQVDQSLQQMQPEMGQEKPPQYMSGAPLPEGHEASLDMLKAESAKTGQPIPLEKYSEAAFPKIMNARDEDIGEAIYDKEGRQVGVQQRSQVQQARSVHAHFMQLATQSMPPLPPGSNAHQALQWQRQRDHLASQMVHAYHQKEENTRKEGALTTENQRKETARADEHRRLDQERKETAEAKKKTEDHTKQTTSLYNKNLAAVNKEWDAQQKKDEAAAKKEKEKNPGATVTETNFESVQHPLSTPEKRRDAAHRRTEADLEALAKLTGQKLGTKPADQQPGPDGFGDDESAGVQNRTPESKVVDEQGKQAAKEVDDLVDETVKQAGPRPSHLTPEETAAAAKSAVEEWNSIPWVRRSIGGNSAIGQLAEVALGASSKGRGLTNDEYHKYHEHIDQIREAAKELEKGYMSPERTKEVARLRGLADALTLRARPPRKKKG